MSRHCQSSCAAVPWTQHSKVSSRANGQNFLICGNRTGGWYLELPLPGYPIRPPFPSSTSGHTLVFSACSLAPGIQTLSTAPHALSYNGQQWWTQQLASESTSLTFSTCHNAAACTWYTHSAPSLRGPRTALLITSLPRGAPNRAAHSQRQLNQILPCSLGPCPVTERAEEIIISWIIILCLCTSVWKLCTRLYALTEEKISTLLTVVTQCSALLSIT